jgi:hypothetical protein
MSRFRYVALFTFLLGSAAIILPNHTETASLEPVFTERTALSLKNIISDGRYDSDNIYSYLTGTVDKDDFIQIQSKFVFVKAGYHKALRGSCLSMHHMDPKCESYCYEAFYHCTRKIEPAWLIGGVLRANYLQSM